MNQHVLRFGRQVAIAIAGGVILVAGLVLAVLPVLPGFPLILLGLGILSLEFERPRAALVRAREWGKQVKQRFEARRARSQTRQ
jgi:uncharacterized membrane protein YbaN (DUF454 family)